MTACRTQSSWHAPYSRRIACVNDGVRRGLAGAGMARHDATPIHRGRQRLRHLAGLSSGGGVTSGDIFFDYSSAENNPHNSGPRHRRLHGRGISDVVPIGPGSAAPARVAAPSVPIFILPQNTFCWPHRNFAELASILILIMRKSWRRGRLH